MAAPTAFDSVHLRNMALPYVPNIGKLSGQPAFYAGKNVWIPWQKTLKKRPGFASFGPTSALSVFPARLWFYTTLEASPVTYIVGSFKNGTVYELRYTKNTSGTWGAWATVTELRGCNHSVNPHEGAVRRGSLYIKGDPLVANDASLLGSVRLDGTGGTMNTRLWGAIGPTVPVALSSPAGWSASAHDVTVLNQWSYTYTWQMISGQETNRAPLQSNPDKSPSSVGAFTNKIPNMTVTGGPDATQYPYVNVYRTTDGGGTFYFLYQIANSNPAGNITFNDTHLESGAGGGTFSDPLPDSLLDTQHQAPSLTSNSPPPTVTPPQVTGTNAIKRCTRIVEYAQRFWYGIDEYLFYSANEELIEGVPEESFPSGLSLPNYYRLSSHINNLVTTPDGLLVMTATETIRIDGTSKSTFNPRPFLGNVGAAAGQARAATEAGENVAWLTQDFRIAVARGDSYEIVSAPLGDHFGTEAAAGSEFQIFFYTQSNLEWLGVLTTKPGTPGDMHIHIYDLEAARKTGNDFWFCPWYLDTTCMLVGQASSTDTQNRLIAALWDQTNFRLSAMDYTGTTVVDLNPAGGTSNYAWDYTTTLLAAPTGDHLNSINAPTRAPSLQAIYYDSTNFSGATNPTVSIYLDSFYSTAIDSTSTTDAPPRRAQSTDYSTLYVNLPATRGNFAAVKFARTADAYQYEQHDLDMVWLPL